MQADPQPLITPSRFRPAEAGAFLGGRAQRGSLTEQ